MMLDQMGDESACELLEVGLGMLARARLSDGLRNSAQSCVQAITRACFARLKILAPADVERLLEAARVEEAKVTVREVDVVTATDQITVGENPIANGVDHPEPTEGKFSIVQPRSKV